MGINQTRINLKENIMKDLTKTIATIFIVALLIYAAGYTIPKVVEIYKNRPVEKVDTILTEKHDTIILTNIKPYTEIKYKKVVDTLMNEKHDTVLVEVPLSVKKYKGDTLSSNGMKVQYRANVSGYRASLDSLWFAVEKKDTTIYKEITITKWKNKKGFKIAPSVGAGYGVINRKPDVYIGVSLSYNF